MSTSTALKSVKLFFRAGTSDKEYHLSLEPAGDLFVVNIAYGKRGNVNRTGTKTQVPVTLEEAEKIYDKTLNGQLREGYVADGEATPFSGVDTSGRVTGLIPMLLNKIDEEAIDGYIESLSWMMQEKLDGKRILCRVECGVATFSNRKGLSVGVPAEIEQQMSTLPDMVVDGELVGNKYILFDLLELKGYEYRHNTASLRFEMLTESVERITRPNIGIVATQFLPANKRALFESLLHKEGVVFKEVHSVYTPGRPNSGGPALKCKFWSSATVRVSSHNTKRSVNMEMTGGEAVGKVTIPPNYDIPAVGALIEVKYLYAYLGGCLIQPQYLGERDDVDCDDVSSLKIKSEDSDED